jgi:hypothetical protein
MRLHTAMTTVAFVALAVSASAQNVTLSPAVLELKGRAGQTTTQTLTITNSTSIALAFEIEVKDMVVRDGKRVLVNAGEVPGSIAGTAVFTPKSLTVQPGLASSAVVTVTLPADTRSRAVVVLFKGVTKITNGVQTATASLGTLMTFAMTDHFSLAPAALAVVPQSATQNAAFEQAFHNDGTEPIVPKGIAVILDAAGALIGKARFETQRLLPGERLTLRSEYPGELAKGTYRVLATFEFEGKSLTQPATLVVR